MPHFTCRCGQRLGLSAIPNPIGFDVLWEPAIEKLMHELVASFREANSADDFEERAYRALYASQPMPYLLECEACGRLAALAHAGDQTVSLWYVREIAGESGGSLQGLCDR